MKQRLKTFGKGGVHPDDKKRLAADRPIRNSYFGQRAVIPMGQDGLADEPIGVRGQVITSSRVSGQKASTRSEGSSLNTTAVVLHRTPFPVHTGASDLAGFACVTRHFGYRSRRGVGPSVAPKRLGFAHLHYASKRGAIMYRRYSQDRSNLH